MQIYKSIVNQSACILELTNKRDFLFTWTSISDTGQIYTWGGRIKGAGKTKGNKSQNQTPVVGMYSLAV